MTRRLFCLATLACGVAQQVRGQVDYVDRAGPAWFIIIGACLALIVSCGRWGGSLRRFVCVAATTFLLPAAVLTVFHVLRLLGAIPLPADASALVTSLLALATIATVWRNGSPLRSAEGRPLQTPRGVAVLGLAVALVYPALKTYWALGGAWLAPAGLATGFDADYVAPVVLVGIGGVATATALRWWDRPAPRFAHPAATLGGLTLSGLGLSGIHATLSTPDAAGPLLGVLVYGGWLLWGFTTLAVAARLSHTRPPTPAAG